MFIKVLYNSQCHVYNSKGDSSFKALQKYIGEVFKKIPAKYYLTYFDDEDEITLACDSDFETMSQLFDKKPAKIYIKEVDESYYDETQKVDLDDEAVEQIEEKMEKLKISESEHQVLIPQIEVPKTQQQDADFTTQISPIEQEKPYAPVQDTQPEITEETIHKTEQQNLLLDQSEAEISRISQITEAQIEEKFRQMIPEFMEKVKDSLLNRSSAQSENSRKPKIVHNHITCDQCGLKNIQGVRYKCAVCADFDLCQKCEVTSTHDHPFLKIKHPGQTPFKIIAIVRDEQENSFEVNGNRVQIPQFPFANQLFDAFCPRAPRPEGHHRFGPHGFGPHGFGPHGKRRGGNGCPFKSQFKEHDQMNEQKVEQKCEPQKKTKVEEQSVEQKMEPKPQHKPEKRIPFDTYEEVPKKREQMEIEINLKTAKSIAENAKYLFSSLDGFVDISEEKSYNFSKKHPRVTKEQLVELYFSQMP